MINWITRPDRSLQGLVCHDGNLDERMAYYDTEELWFPEWEHGGTPWENPEGYTKHNPIDHVKNWKTPTLVIHGGNDFRVVDTQGMSTFTALQRKGVPSKFLHFPDENHWVLKPRTPSCGTTRCSAGSRTGRRSNDRSAVRPNPVIHAAAPARAGAAASRSAAVRRSRAASTPEAAAIVFWSAAASAPAGRCSAS